MLLLLFVCLFIIVGVTLCVLIIDSLICIFRLVLQRPKGHETVEASKYYSVAFQKFVLPGKTYLITIVI